MHGSWSFVYTLCFNFIIAHCYFLDTHIINTSLYTGCTENYVRIAIYRSYTLYYTLCFNFIIVHCYFLDMHIISCTNLYIGCARNYVRIVYTCFNYNLIFLSPWYTYRYEFIYRMYWKLCITLLFPWYAYNKYNFIYKVYWKLCADCAYLFQLQSLSSWYTCSYEFGYTGNWARYSEIADHNISRFFVRVYTPVKGRRGIKGRSKVHRGNWVPRLGFPSSANPAVAADLSQLEFISQLKWELRRILRKRYRCRARNDHCPRQRPAWKVSRVENLETGRGNGYSLSLLLLVTGRLLFLPPSSPPFFLDPSKSYP